MKKFSRLWQSSRKAADRREKKLRVVAHDPNSVIRGRVLILLLLIGTGGAGFYLGASFAWAALSFLRGELSDVMAENEAYQQEVDTLKRRVTVLERGTQISQQAAEEVRQELVRLREEKSVMNRDLRFYRNILDPAKAENGVHVQSFDLQPTADARRFQWKLVVVQNAKNHQMQRGSLQARLEGHLNGEPSGYNFAELTEQFSRKGERLGFRYFQGLPGDGVWGTLNLPKGFEPDRLDVTVRLTSPSKTVARKSFEWIVEESE